METLTATKTTEQINAEILQSRTNEFNEKSGPRVGDYIKLPTERGDFFTRITHVYDDSLQTGGMGGSYYLGGGYISYSGGLDSGIKKDALILSEETRDGQIWFFSKDYHTAHNGVHFNLPFRVFTIKAGADISGLSDYNETLIKIEQSKLPTITRIDGNGNPYTLPLPRVLICKKYNDVFMKHVEDTAGLKFTPYAFGVVAQFTTHEQFNTFMLVHNWKYTYYNNGTHKNLIMINDVD